MFDTLRLIEGRTQGWFPELPSISQAEIEGKSKGDVFAKSVAIIQVLWLIIQFVERWRKGLPNSQLEVAVLAFSVCAFITYCINWEKPQGVETATETRLN